MASRTAKRCVGWLGGGTPGVTKAMVVKAGTKAMSLGQRKDVTHGQLPPKFKHGKLASNMDRQKGWCLEKEAF